MIEDKKGPKTIHLPRGLYDLIDERSQFSCRTRSGEIEFLIRQALKVEDDNNRLALAMAESKSQRTVRKSPEVDDPSNGP